MPTDSSLLPANKTSPATGLRQLSNKLTWIPLLVSFAAGMLVHFTLYSDGLVNPDGLWQGAYSIAGTWELSLGRWGLQLVDMLHAGVNSMPLMALITVFLIALAGTLIVSLFQVKGMAQAILIPTALTCSPLVAMFITYPYCGDAYALSILLGVLAVYAVHALKGTVKRIIASTVCITLLISLYQSSLGVMLAVAAGYVLMCLLRSPVDGKAIGKQVLQLAAAFVLGVLLYYGLTQIFLRIGGVSMADYKGAGDVGILYILQNLGDGVKDAYLSYRDFF